MSVLMADFFCGLAGRDLAGQWARGILAARPGTDTAAENAFLVLDRLGEAVVGELGLKVTTQIPSLGAGTRADRAKIHHSSRAAW